MALFGESSAERAPPPPILYKYRSLELAKQTIEAGTVIWRCPLDFNDPFDVHWDLLAEVRTPENVRCERALRRRILLDDVEWPPDANPSLREMMRSNALLLRQMPPAQRELAVNAALELFARMTAKGPAMFEAAQKDLLRGARVFCSAADELSCLMWSHYGNDHGGVCLGFDVGSLERAWHRPPLQVAYSNTRPLLIKPEAWQRCACFGCPIPNLFDDAQTDACFLTKHTRWQYEMEWRWLKDGYPRDPGNVTVMELPTGCIKEVVFGQRVEPSKITELLGVVRAKSHDPRVFQIEGDERTTELTKKPLHC